MVQIVEQATAPDTIEATLTYFIDTKVMPVSLVGAPGGSDQRVGGGKPDPHRVVIRNGRLETDRFALERNGFRFVRHDTEVVDFFDEDEVRRVYYPEMAALVKAESGAARVEVFDHTLRTADDLLRRRFAVVQVWRPIRRPVESWPLAIADAQTISPENLVMTERRYPDRIGQTYAITYNPAHRWYWFPQMRPDEALVFKTYESQTQGRARWTAHTAFEDPTTPPGARPRESIEIRTLAFF